MDGYNEKDRALLKALRSSHDIHDVRQALLNGANPNLKSQGFPVVFLELHAHRLDRARVLLNYGANANATIDYYDDGKLLPCPIAYELTGYGDKKFEAVKLLREFGADLRCYIRERSLLTYALRQGGYKIAALCVEAGADVNHGTQDAPPVLLLMTYYAAKRKVTEDTNWEAKAVYLVKNLKADRSTTDMHGMTAYEWAKEWGLKRLAVWLDPDMPVVYLPDYTQLLVRSIPRTAPQDKGIRYN